MRVLSQSEKDFHDASLRKVLRDFSAEELRWDLHRLRNHHTRGRCLVIDELNRRGVSHVGPTKRRI